jgi:hypothetical protein
MKSQLGRIGAGIQRLMMRRQRQQQASGLSRECERYGSADALALHSLAVPCAAAVPCVLYQAAMLRSSAWAEGVAWLPGETGAVQTPAAEHLAALFCCKSFIKTNSHEQLKSACSRNFCS